MNRTPRATPSSGFRDPGTAPDVLLPPAADVVEDDPGDLPPFPDARAVAEEEAHAGCAVGEELLVALFGSEKDREATERDWRKVRHGDDRRGGG